MALFLTKNPYSLLSPYHNDDDLYEHIKSSLSNNAFKKECQTAFDCLVDLEKRFDFSETPIGYLQDVRNDFMKFELLQKSIARQQNGYDGNKRAD
jgi:hypothetical protein